MGGSIDLVAALGDDEASCPLVDLQVEDWQSAEQDFSTQLLDELLEMQLAVGWACCRLTTVGRR